MLHCSPTKIDEINNDGFFGDILFFSTHEYYAAPSCCGSDVVFVYEVQDDSVNLISDYDLARREEFSSLVESFKECFFEDFDITTEQVEKLLVGDSCDFGESEYEQYEFNNHLAEKNIEWEIQIAMTELACELGFDGLISEDEQGEVYSLKMLGKESMMKEVKK